MSRSENDDVRERLVLARVGWCRAYNQTSGDEPLAGGSFNVDDVGSEFANFSVVNGRVYGYARLKNNATFNPLRVLGTSDGEMRDVAVALFATVPGGFGQVLVGWYRHADVEEINRDRPKGAYGVYLWSGAAADAVLLPSRLRSLPIPKGKGGTGQANVAYARASDGRLRRDSWISQIRRFMESYEGPSLVGLSEAESNAAIMTDDAEALLRGQNIVQNAEMRAIIEEHAMFRVRAALREEGYTEIEDVHQWQSFDFLCGKGSSQRKVEVKGTRTLGEALLFSNAEIDLAERERVDLYIVSAIKLRWSEEGGWHASGGAISKLKDWGSRRLPRTATGWQVALPNLA